MNKLFALAALIALASCAEKKPLTPEEQWKGYCTSVGNAARTIMLDRQNAIEKDQALAHADKVEDETTRKFIFEIIETVYAMPEQEVKGDVDAAREKIKTQYTEKCLATPYDEMPDYRRF
ncbi:hypothetical protein [Acinetobacter indicus]|uniref:hypothetical protein n=1 Tax=Acinetobacter indicus TaxID=756892 RepID=UPI001443EBCB|nr:hypothetical protein [Acinetobacter indicus]